MKLNLESRSWHNWVGIILSLPILVVAVTAVFIAHNRTLGLNGIGVAAGWLPGYQAMKQAGPEVRTSMVAADGVVYVGTTTGLYRLQDERMVAVDALAGMQVRGLAQAAWGQIAATREGIWLGRDGAWQRVHAGDAWSATTRPDGDVMVAVKEEGLLFSGDGRRWQAEPAIARAVATLPEHARAEPLTLGKLVMDLHTGKALLGKKWEWLWIDLVGLAMTLLALTGVYMWWRGERRKAALERAAQAPAPAPAVSMPLASR